MSYLPKKIFKSSHLMTYSRFQFFRMFSSAYDKTNGNEKTSTLGEKMLRTKLKENFPKATEIHVSDISGGCGAMYEILIEAPEFAGKRTIQQHRMVNDVLKEEIASMHGLQLKTSVPS